MTDFRALCEELMNEVIYLGELPYEQDVHPELLARARAALAQPEPQGPTDEELMDMAEFYIEDNGLLGLHNAGEFASAVLARWGRPAIEPVPIAERLPGPADCDAEGCCWVASEDCPAWHRVSRHFDAWHYWLPHHALPVPQREGSDD